MIPASSIMVCRGWEDAVPTEPGIAAARARAVEALERAGLDGGDLFSIELCIHEALVNALVHGVQKYGASKIELHYEMDSRQVRLVVKDDGAKGELPNGSQNHLETETGRGLWLIRSLTSRMRSKGHLVSMELDRDAGPVVRASHIATKVDPGLGVAC